MIFPVCEKWGARQADAAENQPVRSDIPTMLFGAQFDPRFPPAYAREAAKTLTKRYIQEFQGLTALTFALDSLACRHGR